MKRRRQPAVARLLRALLVSLALAVVITPPVGAALMPEPSAVMAGPAGGSPPPVLQTLRRVASAPAWPRATPATFAPGLEATLTRLRAVVLVRDILLITNRILC